MAKTSLAGFLAYLVFGLYFVNYPFQFVKIPEVISQFDKWVIFIGGIMIVVGGLNYLKGKKPA